MSDMATRDHPRTIADDEAFLEHRSADGERWQLIRGRIVMMSNPNETTSRSSAGCSPG